MDRIDEKLLIELDKNPKISTSKLGKKLRISQQVASYRLKRLFDDKIITQLGTIINLKSLHQEHYRIFFTFNSKKQYKEQAIFDYLRNKNCVYWAARIGGKYDLLVVLFVFDFEQLDRFIDDFNKEFPGLIKDYKSCYALEHRLYKHKYLSKDYSLIKYGYNDEPVDIDELDHYILERIKDDCRLSSLKLADKKDVSYKTIINRIKSLEKRKVILGYRVFIKSSQHNPFIVLLSFKDYSKNDENRLLAYLGAADNVTQLVRLFGLWNLFIHVRIDDNEQLQKFIIELRDKFSIIDDYEIIPVFEDIAINLFPISRNITSTK